MGLTLKLASGKFGSTTADTVGVVCGVYLFLHEYNCQIFHINAGGLLFGLRGVAVGCKKMAPKRSLFV